LCFRHILPEILLEIAHHPIIHIHLTIYLAIIEELKYLCYLEYRIQTQVIPRKHLLSGLVADRTTPSRPVRATIIAIRSAAGCMNSSLPGCVISTTAITSPLPRAFTTSEPTKPCNITASAPASYALDAILWLIYRQFHFDNVILGKFKVRNKIKRERRADFPPILSHPIFYFFYRSKATQVSVVETSLLWWRKSIINFGSSAS